MNLIIFKSLNDLFAIDATNVTKVLRILSLQLLPRQPKFIEGFFQYDGMQVPVFDFRRRFLLETTKVNLQQRIILFSVDQMLLGLIVDDVIEHLIDYQGKRKPISGDKLGIVLQYAKHLLDYNGLNIPLVDKESAFTKEALTELETFMVKRKKMNAKSG
jgi:chemotaxis signal transduction protein